MANIQMVDSENKTMLQFASQSGILEKLNVSLVDVIQVDTQVQFFSFQKLGAWYENKSS